MVCPSLNIGMPKYSLRTSSVVRRPMVDVLLVTKTKFGFAASANGTESCPNKHHDNISKPRFMERLHFMEKRRSIQWPPAGILSGLGAHYATAQT